MNVNDDIVHVLQNTIDLRINSAIARRSNRLAKKCKVYSKLILGKIVEIVAIRRELKCTKFDCGKCFAPDLLGELTALPQLDLRESTSKRRDGRKDGREEQGRGKSGGEDRE